LDVLKWMPRWRTLPVRKSTTESAISRRSLWPFWSSIGLNTIRDMFGD